MALLAAQKGSSGGGGGEETYKLHSRLLHAGVYTASDFTTIHKVKWSAEYKDGGWGAYYAYGEWNDVDGATSSMTGYGVTSVSGNQITVYWDSSDVYVISFAIYGE